MISSFLLLFLYFAVTQGSHFNGGTIRWQPTNPSSNTTSVPITITQSYAWTALAISCATNIPITTFNRSNQNANLTCMADCSTDGNYSLKPVNILTDCQTNTPSMNLVISQRSVNINLTAGAHFYLAHIGTPWLPLNNPLQTGLQWSMVTFIDLRLRPDGFINTPPVASVVSPQYAIVSKTIQITIPVFDVNGGDTVRCRWSVYTPGYRRRKRFDINHKDKVHENQNYATQSYRNPSEDKDPILVRDKRANCGSGCKTSCNINCRCTCTACFGTTCTGTRCNTTGGCPKITTTVETPGTLKPTTSFPNRQAIDECGGICYPASLPSGTTLSGCTISFTGLIPGTWYGVALQVRKSKQFLISFYLFFLVSNHLFSFS